MGSGEFVPAREWTCSEHDYPMTHECDCWHCERDWDCGECATAAWHDLVNDDGTPKLRELSVSEALIRRLGMGDLTPLRSHGSVLLEEITRAGWEGEPVRIPVLLKEDAS